MQKKTKIVEIIKGRLFWISDTIPPKNISKSFYFNIDNDLEYQPFYMDFGPLSLGKMWKYVSQLEKLLQHPEYKKSQIYHHTSTDYAKIANSAFLICSFSVSIYLYQIIILGYSSDKAFQPFKNIQFKPFRDASYGQCTYKCTLQDCLRGLQYAIKLGWFNFKKFNLNQYETYQRVQNGDLNWILPDKFVAFSSPYDKTHDKYGNRVFTPQDYVPIFKKLGVTMVIRLNNKTYQASGFTKLGIKHHDLFFTDGTAPNSTIVDKFLDIVENQPGAIAVHCKAGLGRTGCLIACYAMKHYYFPAPDFIGWIRIARPGSILGPQQHFLIEQEINMRQKSKKSPIWKQLAPKMREKQTLHRLKNLNVKVEMNSREKKVMQEGDYGQGQNLDDVKRRRENQKNQKNEKQIRSNSKSSNNEFKQK